MLKKDIWSNVLSSVEKNVNKHVYNNYLANTKLVEENDEKIIIEVSSQFHKNYIKTNLLPNIHNALNEIINKNLAILFNIKESVSKKSPFPAKIQKLAKKNLKSKQAATPSPLFNRKNNSLNPMFTLKNFVVGDNNRLVFAAAQAVAKNPANIYNPVFIYGGNGLGKSHILHAIGNKILDKNKQMNVIYVDAETFINDVIQSIRTGKMDMVRSKYRKTDVLLIDDIHNLAGKERTQEEFFHTFNALHNSGKQIILTSDKAPKEIPQLEERLRSRFQSGLISDIGLPDIETREAILQNQLKIEKVKVPEEVIQYIVKKIKYNIRDLKSALINIIAQSDLLKQQIDLNMAKKVIKHMIKDNIGKETSISRIQEVVGDYFGVTLKMLKSKKRQANIVLPRQVSMYIINKMTTSSTTEIGNSFGKRDHSTVIHAVEKIKNLIKMDKELNDKVEKIIKELSTESV